MPVAPVQLQELENEGAEVDSGQSDKMVVNRNSHALPGIRSIVADLLQEAGDRYILPRFCKLEKTEIYRKSSDTDLVTVADFDTEYWLAQKLDQIQSGAIIGEERESAKRKSGEYCVNGYSWTIDPIDGTKNFVNGKSFFCTMVALLWEGRPVQSWIWQPIPEELFYAEEGAGAMLFDKRGVTPLLLSDRPHELDKMLGSGNSFGLSEPRGSKLKAIEIT